MSNPFKKVTCAIRYDNARIVSWEMAADAAYPDEFTLRVECARAGGPWENLSGDLEGACAYVDTRRRNYNKQMNECYRVKLLVPDSTEVYVSEIVEAGKYQAYPFSAEAENVLKQVQEAMKISGCSGVLLKKKAWGPRCPRCTDFDDQQTVNEHCPVCFGTGILGGYYHGISMSVIKDSIQHTESTTQLGHVQSVTVQGRCIAYPWVGVGDVWCEDHTNKRFMLHSVTPVASYKETPLVYAVQMSQLEYTDVMYTRGADHRVRVKDLINEATVNPSKVWTNALEEEL